MPASFPDRVAAMIRQALRPLGFAGPRRTWIRDMGATFAVTNLQRSSWSDLCYLNFGVLVDALGRPPSIREELCHLRLRAPHPEPRPSLVEAALDPERPDLDDEARTSILQTYLRSAVDPLLRRWERLELIREDLDSGALPGAAVTVRLRELVGARNQT